MTGVCACVYMTGVCVATALQRRVDRSLLCVDRSLLCVGGSLLCGCRSFCELIGLFVCVATALQRDVCI